MERSCYIFVFILQVGQKYNYKCYRNDNRFLLPLPDSECFCDALGGTVHYLKLLLLLSGDIEVNPGPDDESKAERMLADLLAGQARVSQEINALTQKLLHSMNA
ncbi:hypothetical protein HPB48_012889 [Haemaphysalis longicornis]|uniref:Uncharacterized protein n=1 Tax=Haemaphysalis longicornis TaxID=44386 RepID=A0A9J6GIV8_HAELO|nr:hypothetical protein HPB48_012889 [Haemaphysalis longicornis]